MRVYGEAKSPPSLVPFFLRGFLSSIAHFPAAAGR
jgi:hypothetical protein